MRSLRKDQHAVGANRKRGVAGEAVVLARFGNHIGARMTLEVIAVALPIAVEPEPPSPSGRQADDVAILRLVQKVGDDYNIVRRSALVPTVEGDDFAFVVQVIDLGELPAETAREAVAVEPQPDEVAVEPDDAAELVALLPVERDRVAEPPSFEEFLALEEHRDAGSRKDHRGGQCRTFLRVPALGILRVDLLRHARPAARHLVMRFAVDDPVEGVVVVSIAEGVTDGGERALLILGSNHRLADGVDEVGIPLRAEPGAAGPDVFSEPFVVLQVLGDGDPAGVFLSDQGIDRLKQAPAIGEVLAAGAMRGANVDRSIETEAVHVVFVEPHAGVIEDILAHLAAPVIGPGVAPGCARPFVVVKANAAATILGPAVALPKVEVTRPKVVVNDVEDHRDALGVSVLDEPLEPQGAAIIALDRKDVRRVVTPRPFPRKLGDRHDLDSVDAELFQMLQPGRHRGELAGDIVVYLVECADMQFVDDDLVPRRQLEVIPRPVEARIVDDGVTDRIGHLAGIRINAHEFALRGRQQELVLIADMRTGYICVPAAVLLGLHGVFAAVPAVE